MIELWPRGTDPLITDFQQHGIRIHPSESTVKYEENGQFNLVQYSIDHYMGELVTALPEDV